MAHGQVVRVVRHRYLLGCLKGENPAVLWKELLLVFLEFGIYALVDGVGNAGIIVAAGK